MILTPHEISSIVKQILEEAGVANAEELSIRIARNLVTLQKEKARKGFTAAQAKGVVCHRPKKHIDFDEVKRELLNGVAFVSVAANQHVSESTLRKRLKEEEKELATKMKIT